jgi:hypothetical protein
MYFVSKYHVNYKLAEVYYLFLYQTFYNYVYSQADSANY